MTEISCPCANQQALWMAGDNAVDKSVSKNTHAMSLTLNKSLASGDIQEAVLEALDVLTARVDALEHTLLTILAIVDAPLSPTEALQALRRLREDLP